MRQSVYYRYMMAEQGGHARFCGHIRRSLVRGACRAARCALERPNPAPRLLVLGLMYPSVAGQKRVPRTCRAWSADSTRSQKRDFDDFGCMAASICALGRVGCCKEASVQDLQGRALVLCCWATSISGPGVGFSVPFGSPL